MSYKESELAHAWKISGASHILAHMSLLPIAVRTLDSLGMGIQEAKKRILLINKDRDIPADVRAQGWNSIDHIVPSSGPQSPERFDGAAANETAAIYFSSGNYPLPINVTSTCSQAFY